MFARVFGLLNAESQISGTMFHFRIAFREKDSPRSQISGIGGLFCFLGSITGLYLFTFAQVDGLL